MTLQDYARLAVFVNGALIQQITAISATFTANNQKIDLLNDGLAGFTPGSGEVKIDVNFVVPASGPEIDYIGINARREFVKMQLPFGSKSYVGLGKFEDVHIGQQTNAAVEGSVSWLGEFADLQ